MINNSESKNFTPTPAVFYRYYKLFSSYDTLKFHLLIVMIVLSGLLEGFGITIFIPLLNYSADANNSDQISMVIYGIINFFGFPVNLISLILLLCFVFILKGLFIYLNVLVTSNISAKLNMIFRDDIMNRYYSVNYLYFIDKNIGYFNNLITKVIEGTIGGFVKFSSVITHMFYIFIFLTFATLINAPMTVFAIVVGILLLFFFKTVFRKTQFVSESTTESYSVLQKHSIQILNNFKYLKATHSYKYLSGKYIKQINKLAKLQFKMGVLSGILPSIGEPIIMILMGCIVLFQINIMGETLAETMVLLLFFHRTFTRIFNFQGAWQKFIGQLGSVTAFEKAKVDLNENKENIIGHSNNIPFGNIVFNNVNFSFGKKQILSNITLDIKENSSVGIIGESGAGKTTFFDLITGLIIPQTGNITINGVSLDLIDKRGHRARIGHVTQDPVMFNDTLANNISLQRTGKNPDVKIAIERAAKLANCLEFISDFPEGFNTTVGEKGVKLSGGQRQRIAIAREIFKEPEIMIFDEATSSLDSESEFKIQQSIRALKGKMTFIIIAHRLSTVIESDMIYVLSKGQIVEHGNFDNLYKIENGVFRKMCQVQKIKI